MGILYKKKEVILKPSQHSVCTHFHSYEGSSGSVLKRFPLKAQHESGKVAPKEFYDEVNDHLY